MTTGLCDVRFGPAIGLTDTERCLRWRRGTSLTRDVAAGRIPALDFGDACAKDDLTAGERAFLDFLVEAAVLRLAPSTR